MYTLIAVKKNGVNGNRLVKFWAIFEIVLVTFLCTLIPALIAIGRLPKSIDEVYVPIMSSILVALYSYMRVRDIEIPEEG